MEINVEKLFLVEYRRGLFDKKRGIKYDTNSVIWALLLLGFYILICNSI